MEVRVTHSGLSMVLVNRDAVGLLDTSWRKLGVYFLLGPSSVGDPDRYQAYVGEVGRRNLLTRIKEHVAEKAWWSRALLITSASDDFNSAEIGWLEGRLWDVLNNAVAAEVANKGRPGDDSLPAHERAVLERYVEPIMAALRACGCPPDTADQKPVPRGKRRAFYKESVKDLIDAGLLKGGTQLVPQRKQLTEPATVLPDGRLEVAGTTYASVSGAAQAVSGNQSEPGWEFWGAPSGDGAYVPLIDLRARLREGQGANAGEINSDTPPFPPPPPLRAGPAGPAHSTRPSSGANTNGPTIPRRYDVAVTQLITAGLLNGGEILTSVRKRVVPSGVLNADGTVTVEGVAYASLSSSAKASSGMTAEPGWEYWSVERDGKPVTLFALRDRLIADRGPAA
jgi:hypothetical protein